MKRIEATINPSQFESVRQAIAGFGVGAITAIEVKEIGRHRGRVLVFRGSEIFSDVSPMTKIEFVVADEMAESAVGAILASAKSSKGLDGNISVSTLEQSVRIRVKGREEQALPA